MRIAYLVNRYPAASHSFIRREIEAIEAEGSKVYRFSVRSADLAGLPDSRDRIEVAKTTVLLKLSSTLLLIGGTRILVAAPLRSLAAMRVAFTKFDRSINVLVRRCAYFVEAAALTLRMREEQIDHLHAHFGTNSAMVARIAGKMSGVPYSFTVHGPDEFDLPGPLDLRGKIADSAFVVAISSYGRSQLMRWSSFEDWRKIKVVRCGVDAGFLNDRRPVPMPNAPQLCAVARLSAQKGVPLLIEAAACLKRTGKRFRLTIVGDGEMRPEVEAMIERFDLHDFVELAGWVSSESVIEHLLRARAMVLPSFAEGLPVVIMEALALGRPVIVTAIAGTPELVDRKCGWLIPAGSIEALVKAMGAAIDSHPDQLVELGQVGRERVVAQHDARVNGRQLHELIRSYNEGQR